MPSPYETLISDEYWDGDEPKPKVPLSTELKAGIQTGLAYFFIAQSGIDRAKSLYLNAQKNGYVDNELAAGRKLPNVLDDRTMVRVVEDRRQVYLPGKRFLYKGWLSPEEFDEKAQRMVDEMMYRGKAAAALLRDRERTVKIVRSVSYLVCFDENMLMGFDSSELYERNGPGLDGTSLPTSSVVGQAYVLSRGREYTRQGHTKVARAHLITAGQGSRSRAKMVKVKKAPPRLAFNH